MLDKLTTWLSPAGRKTLYAALAALSSIVAVLGWASESDVAGWVGLIQAVLSFVGLILAGIKARSVDWKVIYVVAAAVVAAVKAVGLIDDVLETQVNQVLAAVVAAVPLLMAFVRTDPSISTGEPADELADRLAKENLASPPLPEPVAPVVEPSAYRQDSLEL
jgi:hypothetical protein